MIKQLLFVFCVSVFSLSQAQNSIQLQINHKLGSSNFALNTAVQNNLGHDFNISRLEYYLSNISITHDGGQTTPISNTWMLVDAADGTSITYDLGTHNITNVEEIRIHVGVESAVNHDDPTTWPSDHPLAPQSPSMHWGWTSGYRFVALEGMGGSSLNQMVQLHGLGDVNYFRNDIVLSTSANSSNEILIALNADYIEALKDIAVNSGNINHGETGDASLILKNFQTDVFSPDTQTMSVDDLNQNQDVFKVFPNPTSSGIVNLKLSQSSSDIKISVYNLLGKEIVSKCAENTSNVEIILPRKGMYIAKIIKNNTTLKNIKLIYR